MLKTPHTYAQWVIILEALKAKSDDQAVLEALQAGTLEWQSGVAERFAQRLSDTLNCRMNQAIDHFQKNLGHPSNNEGTIIQALLALRKEMSFLTHAADLPAIPLSYRNRFTSLVRSQADKIQNSLEDSAKQDRTGKLSSIIRNHKINHY